jgi:hypothetical protein
MSRPDYIRPAGQWPSPLVPTARDARELDQRISELVHSDGGTWAPVDPIAIGGANLELVDSYIEGGVTVRRGGVLRSAQTLPIYYPGTRTRPVLVPLQYGRNGSALTTSMGALDPVRRGTRAGQDDQFQIPGRYMHRGATVSKITAKFRLPNRPPAMPSFPLYFYLTSIPLGTRWKALTARAANDYAFPTADNGFAYRASAGTTAAGEPAWPTVEGATVVDGTVTWTCEAAFRATFSIASTPWAALTAYGVGASKLPTTANGFWYKATVAGTSAAGEPVWPITVGATIVDGTVTWRNMGTVSSQTATTVDGLYANGEAQVFEHRPYNFVIQDNRVYVAVFLFSSNYLLHSLKFDYSNIADARFA